MLVEQRKRDAATMRSVNFRGSTVAVKEESVSVLGDIFFPPLLFINLPSRYSSLFALQIRVKLLEAQDLKLQFSACENKTRKEEVLYEFNGWALSCLHVK